MATKNDVTGDSLITKASSEAYRNNWDNIFGKGKHIENAKEKMVCQECGVPVERGHAIHCSMLNLSL